MIAAPIKRRRVAVFPASRCDSESRLLDSLAELYPVEFVHEGSPERMDGAIFFPEAWGLSESFFERGVNSFRFACPHRSILLAGDESVSFSDHPTLHMAFRNARVQLGGDTSVAEQTANNGHIALAFHGSARLWQYRTEGGAELHTTAVGPPELRDGQLLWSHLRPANWAALLPVLHFLRRVTTDADWLPSPRCASFMFDDPNLHSVRYGYLDFVELVQESLAHNYHVAIATVPLDASYAAPKAVELFRKNRERLSLLMHGNNHVRNELARECVPEDGLRLLAQALRRVGRLERRTGLRVARVIAPPHGGCSESVLSQVLRLPIEGVCTSVGALAPCHEGRTLPLDFGLSPTWFMSGGCPVVRRWDLVYGLTPLRLAAFLGQPIIPYGHHQDCADGLEQLAQVAASVNSWGPVTWTDLESILRCQYRTKSDGELLHIEMRSRRVRIGIPQEVSSVAVHAPAGIDCEKFKLEVSLNGAVAGLYGWGVPIPVGRSALVELSMLSDPMIDPSKVRQPTYQIWAPVRRALSIIRDRVAPVVRRTPLDGCVV